jgi:EAL and modified HD-GYP domain-containing signal transduction protein
LAEKVESRQEFEEAVELECSYIQGYFFSKPVVLSARSIPMFKLNYAQILKEAHRQDFDLRRMEKLIKADLSLSYGLLKLVNSAAFYFVRHIHSIRQALVLLGQSNVRKMVTLVAMSQLAQDKPQELVVNSMIRAAFCESLGEAAGMRHSKDDLFLMGMFSMIDAILDQPLPEALGHLPLSDEVKASLLGERDDRYQMILKMAVSFEKAQWERFQEASRQVGLAEARAAELYRDAVQWVDRLQDSALTVVSVPRRRRA